MFMIIWFISLVVCAFGIIFMEWFEAKTGTGSSDPITLRDVFGMIFLAICPILNTVVCIVGLGWFIAEASKHVVVFKRRPRK